MRKITHSSIDLKWLGSNVQNVHAFGCFRRIQGVFGAGVVDSHLHMYIGHINLIVYIEFTQKKKRVHCSSCNCIWGYFFISSCSSNGMCKLHSILSGTCMKYSLIFLFFSSTSSSLLSSTRCISPLGVNNLSNAMSFLCQESSTLFFSHAREINKYKFNAKQKKQKRRENSHDPVSEFQPPCSNWCYLAGP